MNMGKNGRTENLVSQDMRTKEEQRIIAVKGGKASGKARREKRRIVDALVKMLQEKPKGSKHTRGEIILARVLTRLNETGDMTDLEKLVKILGHGEEEEDKKGAPPVIVINEVVSKNGN